MSHMYRHWNTREPITEDWARANGHAPAPGERWHATRETPYRYPNGRRMIARDAVRLGHLPASDVLDPIADAPHRGNPQYNAKQLEKEQRIAQEMKMKESWAGKLMRLLRGLKPPF